MMKQLRGWIIDETDDRLKVIEQNGLPRNVYKRAYDTILVEGVQLS